MCSNKKLIEIDHWVFRYNNRELRMVGVTLAVESKAAFIREIRKHIELAKECDSYYHLCHRCADTEIPLTFHQTFTNNRYGVWENFQNAPLQAGKVAKDFYPGNHIRVAYLTQLAAQVKKAHFLGQ